MPKNNSSSTADDSAAEAAAAEAAAAEAAAAEAAAAEAAAAEAAAAEAAAAEAAAAEAAAAVITRARVLVAWGGHACGVWADFGTAELESGVAAGVLDPDADEAVFLDAQGS